MDRPYVICHMYTSIDGRIDGDYMAEEGCDISGNYYDEKIFKVGSSMASGRVTTGMYKAIKDMIDLSNYENNNEKISYIFSEHYNFVFDRMGKCFYDTDSYDYGGKTMKLVSVVSTKCDKRYLSYLKEKKIAYIVSDSVKDALKVIKNEFKVETLVLTGGAVINGGFLKENCIDEISLIIAPYVEGNDSYRTSFSLPEGFINNKFNFFKSNPLQDGGVELIFKKE